MQEKVTQAGPYHTEGQANAASLWQTRGRREGMSMDAANAAELAAACSGIELGAYDERILEWLAIYEPAMVSAIAGLIRRAAAGGAR